MWISLTVTFGLESFEYHSDTIVYYWVFMLYSPGLIDVEWLKFPHKIGMDK